MLFQRLIWCALGVAVLLGSLQSGLQQFQTLPILLAAEVFEGQKVEPVAAPAHEHAHADAAAHEHTHGPEAWEPADGLERNAWTWVANVLHAFSMALLLLVVMGLWSHRHGAPQASLRLAMLVAAAGWLSLHFWPSLGLPAEVPGMEAAALGARQGWWLLAVLCCGLACASLAYFQQHWRIAVAAALLALPFIVGAPQPGGDALAGFSADAHAQMALLETRFFWATTWLSLSFWAGLGLLGAVAFGRWVQPLLAQPLPVPAAA
ncbi:CbtA family protein [Rhodoferax sp.]|uniref:CbtA family protein n=1 Tax=Rhodoferax sp. TaxID=50421 RepID=UPI00374D46D1